MFRPLSLCVPFLIALAACNSTASSQNVSLLGPTPNVPVVVAGAGGGGCADVIARFRAVAKSDSDTGNVGPSVYAQIDGEIKRAEAACAAGRDAEARGLIAASKARHGYPANG